MKVEKINRSLFRDLNSQLESKLQDGGNASYELDQDLDMGIAESMDDHLRCPVCDDLRRIFDENLQ